MRLKPAEKIIDREQKVRRRSRCCLGGFFTFLILPILIVGIWLFLFYLQPGEYFEPCPAGETLSPTNQCCVDLNENQICDSKSVDFKMTITISNPSNGSYQDLQFNTFVPFSLKEVQEVKLSYTPQPSKLSFDSLGMKKALYQFSEIKAGGTKKILIKGQATIYDQPRVINLPITGLTDSTKYFLSQNKEIEESAKEIVKGDSSSYEKCQALYQDIVDNYQYQRDLKTIPNALTVLREKKGDCDGFSFLLISQLRSLGIPAVAIYGFNPDYHQTHSWVAAYLDGEWIEADPSQKLFGQEIVESLNLFGYYLTNDEGDWQISKYRYQTSTNSGRLKPEVSKEWQ